MTAKEYLHQAYLLDQRINLHIKEKDELRRMAYSLSAPSLEERVQKTSPSEAIYTRTIDKLVEMERKIDAEIDLLVDLKTQIYTVISAVDNPNYQMVLSCRYIHNMSWAQICEKLYLGRTTIIRWHDAAIGKVLVPADAIVI